MHNIDNNNNNNNNNKYFGTTAAPKRRFPPPAYLVYETHNEGRLGKKNHPQNSTARGSGAKKRVRKPIKSIKITAESSKQVALLRSDARSPVRFVPSRAGYFPGVLPRGFGFPGEYELSERSLQNCKLNIRTRSFEFGGCLWNPFWRSMSELKAGSFEFGGGLWNPFWKSILEVKAGSGGALRLEGVCGTLSGGRS